MGGVVRTWSPTFCGRPRTEPQRTPDTRLSHRERCSAGSGSDVQWLIHGVGLTEGEIVTVEKRDGGTSQEVVGPVVRLLDDGTQIATPGAL